MAPHSWIPRPPHRAAPLSRQRDLGQSLLELGLLQERLRSMEMQLRLKLGPVLLGLPLPLDQPGKAGCHLQPWAPGEMDPPLAGVPSLARVRSRDSRGLRSAAPSFLSCLESKPLHLALRHPPLPVCLWQRKGAAASKAWLSELRLEI